MKLRLLAVALALSVGCGKSSPTAPAPPVQAPPPAPITLALRVTSTNGGQPLPGVSLSAGTFSAITDGEGGAKYQAAPLTSLLNLSLTGTSIVPRTVRVAATDSREVPIDAISVIGFDLNFYRELVRNQFEAPGSFQPLRRWTRNPSIYLQTDSDPRTLNVVERVVREAVPQWTNGQLAVEVVERGTDTREGQAGWITIKFSPDNTGHCGIANVGLEGGFVRLDPKTPNCGCPNVSAIRPLTVRHELGHAMGFWHTDSRGDLMFASASACDQLPSARERQAAAIAYARPVGNTDPDVDPSSAVSLAPMTAR